jgi:hypothetical protein
MVVNEAYIRPFIDICKKALKSPCNRRGFVVRIKYSKIRSEGRQSYYNIFVAIIIL